MHAAASNPSRYTRIDPAQELSRIRHSLSLVEAYIYPHHRASLPRRVADTAHAIIPKKELVDPDVKAPSPGIVGTQTAGGFFAGPTSAATHFDIVRVLSSPTVSVCRPLFLGRSQRP